MDDTDTKKSKTITFEVDEEMFDAGDAAVVEVLIEYCISKFNMTRSEASGYLLLSIVDNSPDILGRDIRIEIGDVIHHNPTISPDEIRTIGRRLSQDDDISIEALRANMFPSPEN